LSADHTRVVGTKRLDVELHVKRYTPCNAPPSQIQRSRFEEKTNENTSLLVNEYTALEDAISVVAATVVGSEPAVPTRYTPPPGIDA
jgi:hypothetical protein